MYSRKHSFLAALASTPEPRQSSKQWALYLLDGPGNDADVVLIWKLHILRTLHVSDAVGINQPLVITELVTRTHLICISCFLSVNDPSLLQGLGRFPMSRPFPWHPVSIISPDGQSIINNNASRSRKRLYTTKQEISHVSLFVLDIHGSWSDINRQVGPIS